MKKYFYFAGIAILFLVIYLASLGISRSGEIKVTITVIPEDSQVLINGQAARSGVVYLKPGSYTFVAKKSGFKDDTVNLKIGNSSVKIDLAPEPASDEARQYLEDNPNIQIAREAIGGKRAQQRGLQLEKQTPLIALLPYTDINGPFSVDYGFSTTRKDGIYIVISNSSPEGRANALLWIRQQGYDPTDMEIQFEDFVSPLTNDGGAL